MQENVAKFQEAGAEVWAVSPDEPDKLSAMAEKMGLTFPLLVDADNVVARAYGILNEESGKVPHPTALVIDREGVVRFMRVDEDYTKRPPAEALLAALSE